MMRFYRFAGKSRDFEATREERDRLRRALDALVSPFGTEPDAIRNCARLLSERDLSDALRFYLDARIKSLDAREVWESYGARPNVITIDADQERRS